MKDMSRMILLIFVIIVSIFFLGCKQEPQNAQQDSSYAGSADVIQGTGSGQADDSEADVQDSGSALIEDDDSVDDDISTDDETADTEYDLEYSLADLDEVLDRGFFFIVGNKAPAMDVVTISEIQADLRDLNLETGNAKLADEVSDYTTEDYIVIGSPCDNPIAAKLLAKEIAEKGDCNIFDTGAAWIKIFKTSPDNIAIFVGGDRPVYTRIAGSVLGNFEDYGLVGTAVEVTGPADRPSVSIMI
ncbi:MAG: hypothetical protein KKE20_05200 [Nanoarchaeota archaeon]|nr:hypothetical protein [Nanoarchaeota archaeon]